jgi:ATP-dependent Lon protease
VRNLEREIANLTRKAVKEILLSGGGKAGAKEKGAKTAIKKIHVTRRNLNKYGGVPKYRLDEGESEDNVGVVTGLAYTDTGGALLSIESVIMPGKGRRTITGQLGDVMQESVQAAVSFVRSRATMFGIEPPLFEKSDIHVHVPEGATPKEGPSAGIAMTTSIVSILTGIPVDSSVAMTGEVTLRGRVLPIGGLKEKLLAALRGNVKTVLIPKDNEKDLAEIPDNVKKSLTIIPVSNVDEVLKVALKGPLVPIEWSEDKDAAGDVASDSDEADTVITH